MSLTIATEAPSFDLPGVDGRNHSLDDYADAPILAVVWSCNHCPYVIAWEGRMKALQEEYGDRGFRLVAINSNDAENYPADSFDATKQPSRSRSSTSTTSDADQSVAQEYGPERTPEVFLDRNRRLVYHGRRSTTAVRRTVSPSVTCATQSRRCSPTRIRRSARPRPWAAPSSGSGAFVEVSADFRRSLEAGAACVARHRARQIPSRTLCERNGRSLLRCGPPVGASKRRFRSLCALPASSPLRA